MLETFFGPDRTGVTININEDVLGVIDSLVKTDAFDEIRFTIHQPRGRHADGSVRRWVVPKLSQRLRYAA